MNRKHFEILAGFKSVEEHGDGLRIAGYASTYEMDRDGEKVVPGAFEKSLSHYMDTNPVMLWNHDAAQPIGHFTGARVDGNGLWVEGVVTAHNHPVYPLIKGGSVRTFSIGGQFGYEGADIKEVDLFEISVVSIPANPKAVFSVQKAFDLTRKGLTPEQYREAIRQAEERLAREPLFFDNPQNEQDVAEINRAIEEGRDPREIEPRFESGYWNGPREAMEEEEKAAGTPLVTMTGTGEGIDPAALEEFVGALMSLADEYGLMIDVQVPDEFMQQEPEAG